MTVKTVLAASIISLGIGLAGGWYATDTYCGEQLATKQADLNTATGNIAFLRAAIDSQNIQIRSMAADALVKEARARLQQKGADKISAADQAKARDIMQSDPGASALISSQELVEDSLK